MLFWLKLWKKEKIKRAKKLRLFSDQSTMNLYEFFRIIFPGFDLVFLMGL
jgi:hypothetical protein